jgi:hypothetical protein
MMALIAMVTIAELLLGDAASGHALDTDTVAHLNLARRIPR